MTGETMAAPADVKLRLLDLYSGAGGAARGYQQAGFHVTGVDVNPQPRYAGDEFIQADALTFPLDGFDVVHASPPCQDHSSTAVIAGKPHGTGWMLVATQKRLADVSIPWVVENVGGARRSMGGSWFQLCGSSFGLGVIRHRLFASSVPMMVPPCQHGLVDAPLYVYGHSEDAPTRDRYEAVYGVRPGHSERSVAMGIDWMSRDELCQAIPPAYTEFIGVQLLAHLEAAAPWPTPDDITEDVA